MVFRLDLEKKYQDGRAFRKDEDQRNAMLSLGAAAQKAANKEASDSIKAAFGNGHVPGFDD